MVIPGNLGSEFFIKGVEFIEVDLGHMIDCFDNLLESVLKYVSVMLKNNIDPFDEWRVKEDLCREAAELKKIIRDEKSVEIFNEVMRELIYDNAKGRINTYPKCFV